MVHAHANKLDILMELLFKYIKSKCFQDGRQPSDDINVDIVCLGPNFHKKLSIRNSDRPIVWRIRCTPILCHKVFQLLLTFQVYLIGK